MFLLDCLFYMEERLCLNGGGETEIFRPLDYTSTFIDTSWSRKEEKV